MSAFDDMSDEEKRAACLFFFETDPFMAIHDFSIPREKEVFFSLVPGMNKEHRLKEFLEHYRKNAEGLRKLPYEGIPDEILYRFCFSKDLFFPERPSRADMIAKMNCYCVPATIVKSKDMWLN